MFSGADNWSPFLYLWEDVFLLTFNTAASQTQPRREAGFFTHFCLFVFYFHISPFSSGYATARGAEENLC